MDDKEKDLKVDNKQVPEVPEEERPPIMGRWRNLYAFVIGFLVLQIIIYYLLTLYLQ